MKVLFKPIEGVVVRHPQSKAVVSENGIVIDTRSREATFFKRRVREGSGSFIELQTKEPEPVSFVEEEID